MTKVPQHQLDRCQADRAFRAPRFGRALSARPLDRGHRGQAIVELAIVLPVLLLLVFGGLQLGIVFWKWQQLSAAVSEGSRRAIVVSSRADREQVVVDAVHAAAPTLTADDLDVAMSGPWSVGQEVTVSATYPVSVNVLGLVVYSGTMSNERTMRVWN